MISFPEVAIAALAVAALLALSRRKATARLPQKPAFVPEAPEGTVPRPGSRRWARALYHNSLIDMEELNAFYVQHPEDFSDPDR